MKKKILDLFDNPVGCLQVLRFFRLKPCKTAFFSGSYSETGSFRITLLFFYFFANILLFADDIDKKIYTEYYFTYSLSGIVPIEPVRLNFGFVVGSEIFLEVSGSKMNYLTGIDYLLSFSLERENSFAHNSLQLYYCFLPDFGFDYYVFSPTWEIVSFPFGINMIYNFDANLFSIGPKIGFYYNSDYTFVSFDYTYNITITDYSKSFHQFTLKFGFCFLRNY